MPDLLRNLFASGSFIPHGHCYLWQPGLVWLHILSDALIGLAYFSIPIALVYVVNKRQEAPFSGLLLLFGAFITACGTTHLMEVWTLWHPTYWLSGVLKAITALISLYAAFELIMLLPHAIALPTLAATNEKLEEEVTERRLAETAQQRYAQRVEGINAISGAILAQQSSRETAEVALLHLRRLVPCHWAAVTLFDFARGQAKVVAGDLDGEQLFPEGNCLPLEYFSTQAILTPGSVYYVEDIASLEHPSLMMQRLLASGMCCCMVVPLFIEDKLIGELKFANTHIPAFTSEHEEIAIEVAALLALAIQKAQMLEQTQSDRERLHTLSAQLIDAQETERRHIARELHDEIGQALTIVKINLQSLKRAAQTEASPSNPSPTAQTAVQDSLDIVEVALQQVRDLSLNLRPSLLDDLGLTAALRWYVDRYSQRTGIPAAFSATSPPPQLPPNLATACFRIVQEALTNVARHAHAHQVTIELQPLEKELHLLIQDDGVGFDAHAAHKRAMQGGSLGLLGMEERALLVGGHLTIHSKPTAGTQIHVHIPITDQSLIPAPAEKGG
ncbi:GAF domain-containing sensor histidine kinase [Pseudanabaena sp. FACHB-2040]|uniref:GAF domain-containing sensor histidine kinase n=1 Tax=Pseudanabaena sp. FACHB-2040 TaxID=2692859 RepID=UPI001685637F|nr:GAF domain-containing sensor histidine kinase [Pseudanabaena sp. FACHB-2040]MBD2257560.1 GAF domain-containing sensor histidine kinase [Pseudanabaena sp. FACHB-2040]